ncbi:SulP family inorganic anion transporter [Isoalcanivorax beigongshangi]|uniref:SulP family inorganic anion transporter n=1 Tax=Isoalcanivorax beigongshangi TaxID=3238810 RepID=A0ABV4ADI7_9GAMM
MSPLPRWLRHYRAQDLPNDLLAALMLTLISVPQGLAYAALAGLPPEIGLYASLLPALVYALFGSHPALAMGPAALIAVMIASALSPLATPGSEAYVAASIMLTALCGGFMLLFGLLRLGVLAQLLSHPVVSGFVNGAALVIITNQLGPLLGVHASGDNTLSLLAELVPALPGLDPVTTAVGVTVLMILAARRPLVARLVKALPRHRKLLSFSAQALPALLGIAALLLMHWHPLTVATLGTIPEGLPALRLPDWDLPLMQQLVLPALVIGLVAYVEGLVIIEGLAREDAPPVNPDRELRALGGANLASAFTAGMIVAASFSRTTVAAEAGARTPLAALVSIALLSVLLMGFTDLLSALPLAVLAAIIIAASWSLIEFGQLRRLWRYDRSDAAVFTGTFLGVLLIDIQTGIALGIGLSLLALIWQASNPHVAVIGQIPGTSQFRNRARQQVEEVPELLMLRIDESLFFGNIRVVNQRITDTLAQHPASRHLVLVMSSVSHMDSTALDYLARLRRRLAQQDVTLSFAEVKNILLEKIAHAPVFADGDTVLFSTALEAKQTLLGLRQ